MPLPKNRIPSLPYTQADWAFVRENYGLLSFDEMKAALNRNGHQIGHMRDVVCRERIAAKIQAGEQVVFNTAQASKRPPAQYSNSGYLALQNKY